MNFAEIATWAEDRLNQIAEAIADADGPKPHVYGWWEEGMMLPAAYMWLQQPANDVQRVDSCHVRDNIRIVLTFAVRPRNITGADVLDVAQVIDIAVPILNTELKRFALQPGINVPPTRGTPRMAADDEFSGQDALKAMTVEIPISIPWTQRVEEPTP